MLQRPLASLLPTSAKIKVKKGDKFTVMLGQQRGSRGLLGHDVQGSLEDISGDVE